jgi:hypothetical protein
MPTTLVEFYNNFRYVMNEVNQIVKIYCQEGGREHAFQKCLNLNQPNQTEMKYYMLIPHNNSFLDLQVLHPNIYEENNVSSFHKGLVQSGCSAQSDGIKNECALTIDQAPAVSKVVWPTTFLLFEHFMFLYEAALVMRVPSNT